MLGHGPPFRTHVHFGNYFLSFGANSELLGEVTRIPTLKMIPEHWTLESSRVLGLGVISEWTPSTWTRDHPEHLDLSVFLEHLDSKYFRAPSHSPQVLHCFDL